MNETKQYRAIAWYIAGYVDAAGPDVGADAALGPAADAIAAHMMGHCLCCGREGVVILDGYFCERCAPGIQEEIDGETE